MIIEFAKTAGAKQNYHLEDIGMRTTNYAELAFGHARNINDKLRIGAKMKVLVGAAYADFSVIENDCVGKLYYLFKK